MDYNENNVCPSVICVESEENSACSPSTTEAASVCLTFQFFYLTRINRKNELILQTNGGQE